MIWYENIKTNILVILRVSLKISSTFLSLVAIALAFITWEDMNIKLWYIKIIVLIGIIFISFIISTLLVLFFLKSKTVWSKGKNKVIVMYGDLLDIGFNKKNKRSKIIVIPVNDTFETIVETSNEFNTKPLVSPNTLHGKWINRYCDNLKIPVEELNRRIQNNLQSQGFIPVEEYTKENRERGNLKSFNLGSTAIINGEYNTKFYLVAISKFDKNNNAYASEDQIRDAINKLIDFYNKNGQSDPIYLPLMGIGSSRTLLSHNASFDLMKSCLLLPSNKTINGEINIVISNTDRNKISIFK
ncbi:MAG: hypothetical protein J1F31_03650 [Erysipelotrichales bacterium]|nr:hypothetical protein [Erysipelotrichales bacterium]